MVSHDGRFEEDKLIVLIAGSTSDYDSPFYFRSGQCYETIVRYEAESRLCFTRGIQFGCFGKDAWLQDTPELRLVGEDAVRKIDRNTWRSKYQNR